MAKRFTIQEARDVAGKIGLDLSTAPFDAENSAWDSIRA
jgi:hypothetical protein